MILGRENARLELPKIRVPSMTTTYEIQLNEINVTPYGRRFLPIAGGASIGNAVENKILDHIVANATYAAVTPSLGLWTSTVDDTSTAATAGELTYT